MTLEALEEFFGKYGTIQKSKLLEKNDRFTGKYWVALESPEAVEKALADIGETADVSGQTL